MKLRKVASFYAIIMGVGMIGMWVLFYLAGDIPELQTKPIELGMHLAAEFGTAILLIVGGWGLLKERSWGVNSYLVGMGMLLYTVVMSPGYFMQQGEIPVVVMFLAFFVSALWLTTGVARQKWAQ